MKTVVLITGIGGDIAQCVATILRESRPDICLVGVDVHTHHGGHLFVDFFLVVPMADDVNYINSIHSVIAKFGVNIFIPITEYELSALYPFTEFFPGVKLIFPGKNVVQVGLDKLATFNRLALLDLPVPWTVSSSEGVPPEYPCIIKGRHGSGSRTVFRVDGPKDYSYFAGRYPDSIFQELLQPSNQEVTCAVYRKTNGEVLTLLMLRRLSGGFTSWAKTIHDASTMELCSRIAISLDLRGSMNIQLILTENGPRVFEINPRFSSTVLMRHRIGFSDALWAIEEAEGKIIECPEIPINKIMVRVQGAANFDEIELRRGEFE